MQDRSVRNVVIASSHNVPCTLLHVRLYAYAFGAESDLDQCSLSLAMRVLELVINSRSFVNKDEFRS